MEYGNLNTQVLYINVFEQMSSFYASYIFNPTYTRHISLNFQRRYDDVKKMTCRLI